MGTAVKMGIQRKSCLQRKHNLNGTKSKKTIYCYKSKSSCTKFNKRSKFTNTQSRRTSLRIRNKYKKADLNSEEATVEPEIACGSSKSETLPVNNIKGTNSDDSVIYIKTTYYSNSSGDIPVIDLTRSSSSIINVEGCSKCESEKNVSDSSNINVSNILPIKRKYCTRSTSLYTFRRTMTMSDNMLNSGNQSMISLAKDFLSNTTFSSGSFWELKKSYPLTPQIQDQANIHSKSSTNTVVKHKKGKEKLTTTSEPLLPDDLKDFNIIPFLSGALNDLDIQSLANIYSLPDNPSEFLE